MLHLINWEALRTKRPHRLMIDLCMLGLALLHLLLLGFDTTYFQLRPYYYKIFPALTQNYDLLKGVEPHRDTVLLQQEAAAYFASCHTGQADSNQHLSQQNELIRLSDQMIEEDPFARAQLSGRLEMIKEDIRNFTGVQNSSKQAFRTFWQMGCTDLDRRQHFFEQQIKPNLELNYWRRLGTNGRFIDYFLYIDLFFICIFLIEFLYSWRQAVVRLGREQKVLYPIYHWYDIVSCIPLPQLRFLRLLRILAVYYRLVRSDVINIRNSKLYQSILKYQAIVMEEISDRVAINILTNIQDKTRLGGSRELIEDTLRANRAEIRNVIVASLQRIDLPTLQLRQPELTDTIANLVIQSVQATDEYKRLSSLPLVSGLVANLISEERVSRMSEQAMDAFLAAWQKQLRSAEMQSILSELVDDVLDQVLELALDDRIQHLIQDINLKILEELKEISTTSKIWRAKADQLMIERVEDREKFYNQRPDQLPPDLDSDH